MPTDSVTIIETLAVRVAPTEASFACLQLLRREVTIRVVDGRLLATHGEAEWKDSAVPVGTVPG